MNDVFLVLAQAPRWADLLRRAAGAARRHPQPARRRPAQGQARQPRERVGRARARRHRWRARLGDEGRGVRTIIEMVAATRLDCVLGLDRADAAHAQRGGLARRPPLGVRRAAGRQAADAERDRRPRRRGRGRHRARRPARRRRRRGRRPARGGAAPDRAAAGEVLGLQAHPRLRRRGAGVPRRQRVRRGVRAARCATARRRSTRSGRARATSTRSTCCARWPASPRCWTRGSPRSGTPAVATPRLDRAIDDTLAAARRHRRRWRSARAAGRPDGGVPAGRAAGALRAARGRRRFCGSRLGTSYDGTYGALAGGDLPTIVDRATSSGPALTCHCGTRPGATSTPWAVETHPGSRAHRGGRIEVAAARTAGRPPTAVGTSHATRAGARRAASACATGQQRSPTGTVRGSGEVETRVERVRRASRRWRP